MADVGKWPKRSGIRPRRSTGTMCPATVTSLGEVLIASAPSRIRAISSASPGIVRPPTRPMIGTVRLTPSRSGWPLISPWPRAGSSRSGMDVMMAGHESSSGGSGPAMDASTGALRPVPGPAPLPARAKTTGDRPMTSPNNRSIG